MAKILLVDSDLVFPFMYQKKFVSSGFDFEVAASGKEALKKVATTPFDIIFIELSLQGESGLDVIKDLRANPEYGAELKIIVLSDSTDRDIHKRAIELRVNGFLAKLDYPPARLVDETQRFLYQFEEQRKNSLRFANGGVPVPKNKRVLLVEDEAVFVDMFGKRLRDEGYDLDIAMNGSDGFKQATSHTYDLIITDMIMSGINGKELIDRLKADERTKDTPVFLFSASVGQDVLDSIRCEGVQCFMKTRITPSDLVREVNKFLG